MSIIKKNLILISIFTYYFSPSKAEELKKLENLKIGKQWF